MLSYAWLSFSHGITLVFMSLLAANADDLLQLLERCKSGLKDDGVVIIKENVCEQGFIVDPVRCSAHFCCLQSITRWLDCPLLGHVLHGVDMFTCGCCSFPFLTSLPSRAYQTCS